MMKKVVLLICDGLGDRPVKELGNLTPLEAAKTPNLDRLASESECGTMCALSRGVRPGSDISHLAIMGYNPDIDYPGRGPIEVAGIGLELKDGDVAFRGNFGTVDDKFTVLSRNAGRILDVTPFAAAIDGMEIDGVKFIVKPGTAHRAGLVMRGKGLSDAISDADPHVENAPLHEVHATDNTPEAKRTAEVLTKFFRKAYETLKNHPANLERVKAGQKPANFILVRGAGVYKQLEPFEKRWGLKAACIAGGGLYKGIGSLLGMKVINVPGANAQPNTDIKAKFRAVIEALKEFDFVFVHVKSADTLAEDGKFAEKKAFIERIDDAASILLGLPDDVLFVAAADHSTPCELHAHSADPVPVMFHGAGVRVDDVKSYGERACARGGLGFIRGLELMPQVMNLLGRLPLVGA